MGLRQVQSIGIQRARSALSEVIKQAEAGVHFLILRFDQPVAALIPHRDYLNLIEVARKDALANALLRGKGYDPDSLTEDEFLSVLAGEIRKESNAGG